MMSSVKVECVVKEGALIGEGPVWEEPEQMLLFVDIIGRKIHRWSPATNQIQSVETGDTVGFAVPRASGGYVAGVGRRFVAVDWSTQTTTSLAEIDEDKPTNRLNDGKVDPIGRLLAGTMGAEERPGVCQKQQGSLFSLNSDLKVTKHFNQVDISNGLDWSLDQRTFYYIDSLSLNIYAFDYEINTGNINHLPFLMCHLNSDLITDCLHLFPITLMCLNSLRSPCLVPVGLRPLSLLPDLVHSLLIFPRNRRAVYHMEEGEGLPDGMTLDADGRLWVACFNGGRVIHIDPTTGVRLQTVSLPVPMITSCCFGGRDYTDLYVTSGSLGLDQSKRRQQPLAGGTFRVTGLGVKGRPSNSFTG